MSSQENLNLSTILYYIWACLVLRNNMLSLEITVILHLGMCSYTIFADMAF